MQPSIFGGNVDRKDNRKLSREGTGNTEQLMTGKEIVENKKWLQLGRHLSD